MRRLLLSFLFIYSTSVFSQQDVKNPEVPDPSLSAYELQSFIESICKYPIPLKEGDQIISRVNSSKNPCCTISNQGWTLKASHLITDDTVVGVQQIVTSPPNFTPQSKTKIMFNKSSQILKKTSEVGASNTKNGVVPGYNVSETYFLKDNVVEVSATIYNATFTKDKKNLLLEGSFKEEGGSWVRN
jgi:hypothetical protein